MTMKKIILGLCFMVAAMLHGQSQRNGLSLNHYNQHVGLGGSLLYQRALGKGHTVGIGIKYNDNYNFLSSEYVDFHKTAYAKTFTQHIGIIADYSFLLKPKNWRINPYIFYNVQYLHAGLREQEFLPNPVDPQYYKPTYNENDPLSILEQYVGLRLEMPLFKNTYFNFSFASGFIHFWNFDENLKAQEKANSKTVFGSQLILGITQKF
jgi:hypothetical protein